MKFIQRNGITLLCGALPRAVPPVLSIAGAKSVSGAAALEALTGASAGTLPTGTGLLAGSLETRGVCRWAGS